MQLREAGRGKREACFAIVRFPLRASRLTLLLATACATVQDPPGGPPDLAAPVLLSMTPDSGSVLGDLKKAAVLQFDEVISERPGSTLDQLIIVSPKADALNVAWKRDAIEVRPRSGWKPNVPYQLTLLPGIMDLRNNKLSSGRTIAFSTGGAIPATRTGGRAIDWETGGAAPRALVELMRPDSLTFWTLSDSTGAFALTSVPPGRYVLSVTIDKNSNRKRDYREPFDSAVVTLDSTLDLTLWAFVHDTVGPRIRTAQKADSLAIRLEFNQPLAPGGPGTEAIRVRALPDSTVIPVSAIRSPASYDSARADAQRQPADSTRTPAARPAVAAGLPTGLGAQRPGGTPARADSGLIRLLATRPRLTSTVIVMIGEPLRAGSRYVINAAVSNVSGTTGESTTVLVIPVEPVRPRRDSTRADSTRADSARVRP